MTVSPIPVHLNMAVCYYTGLCKKVGARLQEKFSPATARLSQPGPAMPGCCLTKQSLLYAQRCTYTFGFVTSVCSSAFLPIASCNTPWLGISGVYFDGKGKWMHCSMRNDKNIWLVFDRLYLAISSLCARKRTEIGWLAGRAIYDKRFMPLQGSIRFLVLKV